MPGSWLSARAPRLRDIHEYLLVFSKGGFSRLESGESDIDKEEFMAGTLSIWEIPPESAKKVGHPAPFPVELASRVIRLFYTSATSSSIRSTVPAPPASQPSSTTAITSAMTSNPHTVKSPRNAWPRRFKRPRRAALSRHHSPCGLKETPVNRRTLKALWRNSTSQPFGNRIRAQSGGARLLGMAGLSLRQLQHRFLESFLILLSIALGVGVLTGMGAFLRFLVALEAEMLSSQAELQAVIVRPRTFDTTELWSAGAPPAVRLTADVVQPIQLTTEDLLAVEVSCPALPTSSRAAAQ